MEGLHDRTESKVEFPKVIETDIVGDANSDNDDQVQLDPQSTASRQDIQKEATPERGVQLINTLATRTSVNGTFQQQ